MDRLTGVSRALALLELFAGCPSEGLRERDVVAALNYPQSTCCILLKKLVQMGYLRYRQCDRLYLGTPRIGMMGDTFIQSHPVARQLNEWLGEIHDETGHLSFVAQQNGHELQYIAFKQARSEDGHAPSVGMKRPLAVAASGRVILAFMPPNEAQRIVRRNNSESEFLAGKLRESDVLNELQMIRRNGFARSNPCFTPGLVGYATWLSGGEGDVPFAIGMAIPVHSALQEHDSGVDVLLRLRSEHLDRPEFAGGGVEL